MKGWKTLHYRSLHGLMPPLTVVSGVDVAELVKSLVEFYFPGIKSIWDPTCGRANHQFSRYLVQSGNGWLYLGRIRYVASDIIKTKWNCVDSECLVIDVLKPPYQFRDGEFDLIVYDPPYMPYSVDDRRAGDYDTSMARGIGMIKRFYGAEVMAEFSRVCRRGVIVKGSDIYYPPSSDTLILFMNDILDINVVRRYFHVQAMHIYRFFRGNMQLVRARLGKSMESRGFRRPVVVHTYYVVLRKKARF